MLTTVNVKRTEPEIVDALRVNLQGLLPGLEILNVVESKQGPDLMVVVGRERRKWTLAVEAKSIGEPRNARQAIVQLREYARRRGQVWYPVFAAPYVGAGARELCRDEGVGYLDLAGNAYLSFGPVLIDRLAADSPRLERRGLKSLVAPKATRVLRQLLFAPTQATRITELAQRCSMSPAGVFQVVRMLELKDYVERDSETKVVLRDPAALLDAWATGWDMSRSIRTSYFSLERTPEALMRLIAQVGKRSGLEYAFTLLAGASLVAPFVRFQDVWFYISGEEGKWVKELDLRPVSGGGNVVMVQPYDRGVFAGLQGIGGAKVVSNVQLYVDLYNFPARGREQAQFLREKRLRF